MHRLEGHLVTHWSFRRARAFLEVGVGVLNLAELRRCCAPGSLEHLRTMPSSVNYIYPRYTHFQASPPSRRVVVAVGVLVLVVCLAVILRVCPPPAGVYRVFGVNRGRGGRDNVEGSRRQRRRLLPVLKAVLALAGAAIASSILTIVQAASNTLADRMLGAISSTFMGVSQVCAFLGNTGSKSQND